MSDSVLSRPEPIRYVVRWRRLSELVALTACAAIWAAFLLHAG